MKGLKKLKIQVYFRYSLISIKNCHLTLSLPLSLIFLTRHIAPLENTVEAFLQLQEDARVDRLSFIRCVRLSNIRLSRKSLSRLLKKRFHASCGCLQCKSRTRMEHLKQATLLIFVKQTMNQINLKGQRNQTGINNHAHEYGFIIRYQKGLRHLTGYRYEPWHITFVGERVARLMHYYQIGTLEEFMTKFIEPYNQ